jgi:hypothetical protein
MNFGLDYVGKKVLMILTYFLHFDSLNDMLEIQTER